MTSSKAGRPKLPCFYLNHVGFPVASERTILLTGVARSGTSFLGSVVGRLGVPMRRNNNDRVSGHWEHKALRETFQEKNSEEFEKIVSEFNQNQEIWAWKLPGLRTDFEWVASRVRNPCFVFSFKEPLSMAMRKVSTGHDDDIEKHFRKIFKEYSELLAFARSTGYPTLLISYDKALRQIEECIGVIAQFCGVEQYELAKVVEGIQEDGERY